ncbi:Abi family protein [Marinilactibacillus psychrotolerans]|uniref:Abi family protein n=1 Tax=Marinilactibacillus psychrotolerans TaxID=191770 RepID=UPI001865D5FF|nr:Abi family protein [Marinilactibacillus psychrotolerans]
MKEKPKLTFDELVRLLTEKGITFNYHSAEEAKKILAERNYYYRLASYRKNFKKNLSTNKYLNCDFKHLVDLSSIDVYLREYLYALCLDIEHAAKTKLMKLLTLNKNEDGYSIVKEFEQEYPKSFSSLMFRFSGSHYHSDMFTKRKEISIWVLLENADFGQLTMMIELYSLKVNNKDIALFDRHLKFVKNIRNTTAHNNIFIINFFHKSNRMHPSTSSVSIAREMKIDKRTMNSKKLHDMIILFYLHKKYCSPELNSRRHQEGNRVLDRICREKELYSKNEPLKIFFKLVNFLVDSLN